MAKETVDRIREAEKAAALKEQEARKKASDLLQKASDDAGKLLDDRIAKETADGEIKLQNASSEAEQTMQKAMAGMDEELNELRKKAEARMPQAVDAVLKALTE